MFLHPIASVRLSRLTLTVLILLQVADGLMTFGAVQAFGTAAEGNPVLQMWMRLVGPAVTLLAAKGVACGLATLLYFADRQRTLVALAART